MTEEFPLAEYQSFMENYVRRINEATLNVRFGGVRIGNARYTRLAQINLRTRVITFSRFAIENVPERGRRYLVLHELAHVRETTHNRRFWNMVAKYEPDYRRIGREIQNAFARNVEEQTRVLAAAFAPARISDNCIDEQLDGDETFVLKELPSGVIYGGAWACESENVEDFE